MYKLKHNLSPSFMHSVFPSMNITYNLRNNLEFKTGNIRTTYSGSETLTFRGPKTCDLVPKNIKASSDLNEFKVKINLWKPEGCVCRMCRVYINNLGFI